MKEFDSHAGPQGPRVQLTCNSTARTQQHMRDECDVNQIMKKWRRTGELTHLNPTTGVYGNFASGGDYLEAINQIEEANEQFGRLDAEVRSRFNNNPNELLEFVMDDANREEAMTIGIIPKDDPVGPPAQPPAGGVSPPVPNPPAPIPANPSPIEGGE